jgi:CheY-like chemotaxis protein
MGCAGRSLLDFLRKFKFGSPFYLRTQIFAIIYPVKGRLFFWWIIIEGMLMRRKRILVAEDDPTVVSFYCDVLNLEGYEVVTAANGREALEKIREEKPDLAILDLRMPVMDGLEVLNTLYREGDPTPIVISTAYGDLRGDVDVSYGEVQAFLNKPVRPEELSEAIRKALGVAELIGQLLERYGLISKRQLREALVMQSTQPQKRIGEILLEMGALDRQQWVNFIARLPGVARINLKKYVIDPNIVRLLPEDVCRETEMVAIDQFESVVTVAMAYPYNLEVIHDLSKELGLRVKAVMATREEILEVLDSVYAGQ